MNRLFLRNTVTGYFVRNHSVRALENHKIGSREIVGFGANGTPSYHDSDMFPMPAVRFRPDTPEIKILREKEKGDWKCLSMEEKKTLYRASFCQTFSEFLAPSGEWKSVMGFVLIKMSIAMWLFLFIKKFVSPPLPDSFKEESRRAQLRRILDLKMNPIAGISSKWDYEKDDWKK